MVEQNIKTDKKTNLESDNYVLKNTLKELNEELKEILTALEQNNWARLIELQQLPTDFTLPALPAEELGIEAEISDEVKQILVDAFLGRFSDFENDVLQNLKTRYPLLMQYESLKSEMSEVVDTLNKLLIKLRSIKKQDVEMTGDDPVSVSS